MLVIETDGLSKTFKSLRRSSTAIDGLNLSVPEGGVFGFLGPNGSGKTTSIRCLLDLVRPSSGSAKVLGVGTRDIHKVLDRIGCIVETPSFFPGFTAFQNLQHLASLRGLGKTSVLASIQRVGLEGREDDLFRTFSLGMKQRLGLAAALLKDPELLILDEPAHGLDPEGIRDIRVLIRSLGEEGRTVFLSSHLLNEIETMCDRVAIISRGKSLRAGPVREIVSSLALDQFIVVASDLAKAAKALERGGMLVQIEENQLRVTGEGIDPTDINRILVRARIYASELRRETPTLEDAYLRLRSEETP